MRRGTVGLHAGDRDLEVIDGQKEANYSASGVLEALDPKPHMSLVIDIGGGSTELVLLENNVAWYCKNLGELSFS